MIKPHDEKKPAASAQPADSEEVTTETTATIARLEKEAAENLAGWQRAKADLENFRKRNQTEQAERRAQVTREVMTDLLPVIDNIERAFAALTPEQKEQPWLKGFALIQQQLTELLRGYNITRFESVGKPFDPARHEAIADEAGEKDVVVKEVLTGYQMGEVVLRPAQVIVGNGQTTKEAEKAT